MDPVEERDIEKMLALLDEPRILDKLCKKIKVLSGPTIILMPADNVVEHSEEK